MTEPADRDGLVPRRSLLYRKKPVVIEAQQFDGSWESAESLVEWITSEGGNAYCQNSETDDDVELYILTLEGAHRTSKWDQVIQGVAKEFYPCKPDIFEATYEPVEPS